MREVLDRTLEAVQGYVPSLVAAIGVLVGGWLVALIIAAMVRAILKRTTIDNKIAEWLGGEKARIEPEKLLARIVFWILMIVVLVGFFQLLGLTSMSEPLNRFLDQVFAFLPSLISAGVLLLVAWMVATGLRFAVRRGLQLTKLDERLSESLKDEEGEEGKTTPLTRTLSETVYWLVFLLFLPAVLDALSLEGLLAPVNSLLDEILAFLPNLLAAALIVAIGWLVARIVRRIVTNLLRAVGADDLSERVGIVRVLGHQRLSGVIGLVVYILLLVPVVIAGLNALQLAAVTEPASRMLETLLGALPRLFAAGLLLLVAWVLARLVSGLTTQLLGAIGFDRIFERIGFGADKVKEGRTPSEIAGTIAVIVIMLFGSIEALRLLAFNTMAGLAADLTVFLGKVALGVAVFAIGLFLADIAARTIHASGLPQNAFLANAARVAILVLAGAMALRQINVAEDIINLAFGLTLGAIAVATALAFGLGGRDVAARYLESLSQKASGSGDGSAPAPPKP
jgi:hypothetical protein